MSTERERAFSHLLQASHAYKQKNTYHAMYILTPDPKYSKVVDSTSIVIVVEKKMIGFFFFFFFSA